RLLVFKDHLRIHHRHDAHFNHPAPLRSASLHLQQRNEIMRHLFRFVKNIFSLSLKTSFLALRAAGFYRGPRLQRGGES
ncbi:hypothetical protein ACTJLC_23660, partial [Paraburkholderia sp. 22099]|uniref:hypothetical protein n=1 Tax=Paraburkholderia sp. 22099 TaxID=3453875 RepID=UPI003F85A502